MLDVHSPHHAPQGVRDFFIHLFTITVGLLIALGLEAGVEAVHHRHQRQEAEATIREELHQNRENLKKVQKNILAEQADLQKELVVLEDLRDGKHDDVTDIQLSLNNEPLQSAGWHTAANTGALSYMPYATVQRFSLAYDLQENFERAAYETFAKYEVLHSYVAASDRRSLVYPKNADVENVIRDIHLAMADLKNMQDTGRGTLRFTMPPSTRKISARIAQPRRDAVDRRRDRAVELVTALARTFATQQFELQQAHRIDVRIP